MPTSYQICFLGYGRLTELARKVIAELDSTGTEILLVDCNVETLPRVVDDATRMGIDVFVGGSANAAEFFRHSGGHLTEIIIRDIDYLLAIQKALLVGRRPVIAVYRYSRTPDVELYRRLSGVSVSLLTYEDGAELYQKVEATEADVIIGASHANEVAQALNKMSVLVYPGEGSVRDAIRQARTMATELHKEKRNQSVMRAIVNNSSFGIVVSDEQDRITLFNHAAQRLTGSPANSARGRLMSELFPSFSTARFFASPQHQQDEYRLVGEAMVHCTQTKISVRNKIIGVLTILNQGTRSRKQRETGVGPVFFADATFDALPSDAPLMARAVEEAQFYAQSESPMLLVGEEGSGREQLAQCIHNHSSRRAGPYVRLNLAAIAPHDAGRFLLGCDDKERATAGLLELANRGTVVLENIALAPVQAVRCILDVLDNQRVLRLGKAEPIPVNLRVLTLVTDEELAALSGAARYKLGVFQVNLPPLCQRPQDLPGLFLTTLHKQFDVLRKEGLSDPMVELLLLHRWPGNLHELSTVCHRYALALAQTVKPTQSARLLMLADAIGAGQLLQDLLCRFPALAQPGAGDADQFCAGVDAMKRLLGYGNAAVAEKLGISRTTLWRLTRREG